MAKKSARAKPGSGSTKHARVGKRASGVVDASAAATAATAGALLSAGVSPVGAALVAGAATVLAGLVGGGFKFLVARAESRWHLWYAAYVEGFAEDPALVEAHLHAEAEDPIVQELVVENARAIAEALTDSVVPVLARLTREYKSAKRRPDAFFRGMRRVLSDLSEDEYGALRGLVGLAASVDPRDNRMRWVGLDRIGETVHLHALTVGDPVGSLQSERHAESLWSPVLERLFHLLDANGLATDTHAVAGVSNQYAFVLEIAVARRMKALFS
jgi:hypothetical protein